MALGQFISLARSPALFAFAVCLGEALRALAIARRAIGPTCLPQILAAGLVEFIITDFIDPPPQDAKIGAVVFQQFVANSKLSIDFAKVLRAGPKARDGAWGWQGALPVMNNRGEKYARANAGLYPSGRLIIRQDDGK